MSDNNFIGEIRAFPYTFAPQDWLDCSGQTLAVSQYQYLFAVIGSTFGGDGKTTFQLPNLQGLAPRGVNNVSNPSIGTVTLGQKQGVISVTLTGTQIPSHTHTLQAETMGYAKGPTKFSPGPIANTSWPAYFENIANPSKVVIYEAFHPAPPPSGQTVAPTNPVDMNAGALSLAGGGGGHENRQPYLAFRFCICTQGIFPERQ